VGKHGESGEFVRCVVSVAMLNEGWDANNVTQVLGIRAFGSQLLCEQVVGRGLRRMSYEPDPVTGLLAEEYVDVYGIPFSVIPYKGRPVAKATPEDKPKNRVWALPDREEMDIRFPIVEGYVFETKKGLVKCNVDEIEPLRIDSNVEPTATYLRLTAGYLDTHAPGAVPFEFVKQDRQQYYAQTHLQTILFQITQTIIDQLLAPSRSNADKKSRVMRLQSRHMLFPQVFSFVQQYVQKKVDFNGVDQRELGLEKYTVLLVERMRENIYPDDSAGEPPLLPVLNSYRPYGSTGGVDFITLRPILSTKRSHLNAVVLDSGDLTNPTWEAAAAKLLDSDKAEGLVKFYARNDHLGLDIPYEYLGNDLNYRPDFLVRLTNDLTLILEIKGYEVHDPEKINAKHNAVRKRVAAVNNLGDFGKWTFLVCRDLDQLLPSIEQLLQQSQAEKVVQTVT
jgi:type III restriction enzyme